MNRQKPPLTRLTHKKNEGVRGLTQRKSLIIIYIIIFLTHLHHLHQKRKTRVRHFLSDKSNLLLFFDFYFLETLFRCKRCKVLETVLSFLKSGNYNLTHIGVFGVRRGVGSVNRGVNWT